MSGVQVKLVPSSDSRRFNSDEKLVKYDTAVQECRRLFNTFVHPLRYLLLSFVRSNLLNIFVLLAGT